MKSRNRLYTLNYSPSKSDDTLKLNDRLFPVLISIIFWNIAAHAQSTFWKRHTIDAEGSGADGVRLADINKDNLMDITTGWEESGETKVYFHPGYDLVSEKWPSMVVGKTPSIEDAVFGDLDGDGAFDVISSTEGKNRKVYVNWGPSDPEEYSDPAKWKSEVIPVSANLMQWMYAFPAQIDGINGMDLIVGAKGKKAKIGWFQAPENPRQLSDWTWHPVSDATWIMSLFLRDMDDDGDMDIVTSDRKPGKTNGVRWLENPGVGRKQLKEWDNHFIGAQNTEVMFMDMADLDGDGLEDAIVTEYTNQKIICFKRQDKNGLKWEPFTIDIPEENGRAKAVSVGDINGDGVPDLVHSTNTLGRENKVGIVWMSFNNNPTDPVWEWYDVSGPEGYKFDRMELLDIDGDGDLDVLTCEENYGDNSEGLGVIWYENPLK